MKELSIEEKARAYDMAIARANEMIKAMTNIGGVAKVDDIQHIFPELKESEDERIKKTLVEFFVDWGKSRSHFWSISVSKILAWLEKQSEQKPTNEEMKELLRTEYEKGRADAIAEMQKPAKYEMPLLEKFKQAVYDCAWGKVTCKVDGESQEEYANRWAEHFLLMVRDWADDYIDFTIQQKLRNSYKRCKTDLIEKQDEKGTNGNDREIPNSAWSGEDESIYQSIIDDTVQENQLDDKQINWLKSLKERCTWKPSDGQMAALMSVASGFEVTEKTKEPLKELFVELKKLREE